MKSDNATLEAPLSRFDPDLSYVETKAALVSEFERYYVTHLLETNYGNLSLAARTARMDRKHLHGLMKKHQLEDVRIRIVASSKQMLEK